MAIDEILTELEEGKEVTVQYSDSFINALQLCINLSYIKFDIDIQMNERQVKMKLEGEYIRK